MMLVQIISLSIVDIHLDFFFYVFFFLSGVFFFIKAEGSISIHFY